MDSLKWWRKFQLRWGFSAPITRDEFRYQLPRTGKVLDFTRRFWGHNLSGGCAWSTPRLQNGDVVITEKGRFIAYNVKPCGNLSDMVYVDFIAESDGGAHG